MCCGDFGLDHLPLLWVAFCSGVRSAPGWASGLWAPAVTVPGHSLQPLLAVVHPVFQEQLAGSLSPVLSSGSGDLGLHLGFLHVPALGLPLPRTQGNLTLIRCFPSIRHASWDVSPLSSASSMATFCSSTCFAIWRLDSWSVWSRPGCRPPFGEGAVPAPALLATGLHTLTSSSRP